MPRLKAMWMCGDYAHFARHLEPGALEFFRSLAVTPGERVLDAGCGAGQLALPAARAGAKVTGVDIAPNLVEQARARAAEVGQAIQFDAGDAEDLPHADHSFDLVVSLIGAMFAPRPERVSAELLRVCGPGGRIVMGNWTPGGFIGQMFRSSGRHVPPPPGMTSPVSWGDEERVRERCGDQVFELRLLRRTCPLEYPFSPADVVEFFGEYHGPTNRAFAALEAAGHSALRADLEAHWTAHNEAGAGRTAVAAGYLAVMARRA
jgi:SAM-dependent methyltransferase